MGQWDCTLGWGGSNKIEMQCNFIEMRSNFLKAQVGWIGRGNEVRPHGLETHLLYHRLQGSHHSMVVSTLNIELLPSYNQLVR